MYCETLLERIRNQYYSVIPRGTEEARIIDSITQNLDKVLNHQQGSALAAPDLGLPDFNSTRFGDGLQNIYGMARVIEQCITKYEPRARDVRAEYMKDEKNPLQLLFKISMSVKKGKDFIPLVFETVMGMDGIIYVNSSSQN